ncbi:hypothetical protein [Salegentibacter flavus]|uniref:hypothetical protein n=1 Tax=Salegentibacter flavus TaxID=287099 RepID=UPI000B89D4F6|nr:hypothetical protein [Salegentibacter flavus]
MRKFYLPGINARLSHITPRTSLLNTAFGLATLDFNRYTEYDQPVWDDRFKLKIRFILSNDILSLNIIKLTFTPVGKISNSSPS